MGIETSADHGGAECGFTSAIVVIEGRNRLHFIWMESVYANYNGSVLDNAELAKVDPSVSVLCDVHNTLVNTVLRKYATKEVQDKYLPQLAESKVGCVN